MWLFWTCSSPYRVERIEISYQLTICCGALGRNTSFFHLWRWETSANTCLKHGALFMGINRDCYMQKNFGQKPLGGRWNSITEVEQRMRSVGGKSMLEWVLSKVLASKKNEKTLSNDNDTSRQNVGDISFEETKQNQKKMGIWRTRTLEYVQDGFWWVLSDVMRIAQSAGTHFSVTLVKWVRGHWTLELDMDRGLWPGWQQVDH